MKPSFPALPILVMLVLILPLPGTAMGGDDWRNDFDAACASTTNAVDLTVPQLNGLLEKCDRVQKTIEQQEETVRKVYLKRLQMCRNLYAYVLDFKKNAERAQ